MNNLKVGLIGCTGMANAYRNLYTQIDGAELNYVVGLEVDNPKQIAEQLNCPNYSTDYMDCIKSDVDIVDISTPNHLHREQFKEAVKAGKHVILQKPIAASIEDAIDILQTAKETKKNVGMFMSRHASPIYREIKKMIESGLIGKVTSIQARTAIKKNSTPRPGGEEKNWRSSIEKTGGGSLIQLAVHDYDMIQWLLNEKITEVSCFSDNMMTPSVGGDDNSQTIFRTQSGVIGNVSSAYCSNGMMISIYGDKGIISYFVNKDTVTIISENIYISEAVDYSTPGVEQEYKLNNVMYSVDNPYEQHVEFIKSIIDGKEVPVSIEDGFYSFMVVKAAYKSSTENKTINVNEFINEEINKVNK